MLYLRSALFHFTFYTWSALCVIILSPTLMLPRKYALWANGFWITGVFWICEHFLGLGYDIRGWQHLPKHPYIVASKHQSAWETMIFHHILHDPALVLKKQLMWIPFFGWYLKKLGMIPISRAKNKAVQDLRQMVKAGKQAIAMGQPIVIFPEGTRSKPGQKNPYQSGIASLYQHLDIPVVPVAHNAGIFWPRRCFLKKPGTVRLEFLPPLYPGFSRKEFMTRLEESIEKKTNQLIAEACPYETHV